MKITKKYELTHKNKIIATGESWLEAITEGLQYYKNFEKLPEEYYDLIRLYIEGENDMEMEL